MDSISSVFSQNSNAYINGKKNYVDKNQDDEDHINEEGEITEVELPPQRDIRDTQPTISVNYRVVRNKDDNNKNNIKLVLILLKISDFI